eukprot:3211167-Amphidinium_carterae.1
MGIEWKALRPLNGKGRPSLCVLPPLLSPTLAALVYLIAAASLRGKGLGSITWKLLCRLRKTSDHWHNAILQHRFRSE